MEKYNPKENERKWQQYWEAHNTFATPQDATKENKCYILPQLPYPSGSGLHVGHAEVYTACDIYARYQRMRGKKVLQVFGLDSFGLPAENYAIKTNVHPKQTIEETSANFVDQVQKLGVSVDWDRFVRSSDPEYYKFTQWFFLLMYERGLAYRKKQAVNWCDSCKTVLANDQVTTSGECERCGTVIVQKEMEQWYLKITDYAEKLLEGLDRIDWPEETKKRQRDWIGKSEGAEIEFLIRHSERPEGVEESRGKQGDLSTSQSSARDDVTIIVFTTRPDTLFGATYMVLAPEGEYVKQLQSQIQNWDEVEAYITKTAKKTDLERQVNQEKTGVELKGVKAVNPANGEEIPIWIADYVIATYGTGAIMAVPAHDERDFVFAKKFGIEVREVVVPELSLIGEQKKTIQVYNDAIQEYVQSTPEELSPEGKEWIDQFLKQLPSQSKILEIGSAHGRDYKILRDHGHTVDATDIASGFVSYLNETFGGGTARELNIVEGGIDIEKYDAVFANASLIHLTQEQFAIVVKKVCRSMKENGFFAVSLKVGDGVDISENKLPGERYYYHWNVEEVLAILQNVGFEIVLQMSNQAGRNTWMNIIVKKEKNTDIFSASGKSINSDFLNDLPTQEAKTAMIDWLEKNKKGTRKIQYRLRDWSVSRQRFWGAPIPMLRHTETGELRPIPVEDLPVMLPDDVDFKPTGQSPLTYSEDFQKGVEEKYGKGWKREVDTLDTFMCSSWYFFRYLDPHNTEAFASPEALKAWMPVDFYLGGPEHVNGHLLFARFFTKVLCDAGYIDFDEPFTVHRHQGLILGPDGRKMSKRWGNVVNPTDIVDTYGADAMRMYEMFMGPLEDDKPWDENGVKGVKRFLDKVWNVRLKVVDTQSEDEKVLEKKLHQTVKKVGEDIEHLSFNTSVAKLMELVNEMNKTKEISKENFALFVKLLSPFAPHMAEELWSQLGHDKTIAYESWPEYDVSQLIYDVVTIAVQVNGKVRASISVSPDAPEDDVKALALAEENVVKWMEGNEPKKVIYVQGKIVNIVV